MGLQRKLNLILAVVVLLGSVVLAGSAAWLEHRVVLTTKQEHLEHLATWVSLQLDAVAEPGDLNQTLREVADRLSESTGERHRVLLVNASGDVTGGQQTAERSGMERAASASLVVRRRLAFPAIDGGEERWVQVEEPVPDDLAALGSLFVQHLGFAMLVSALAMLTVGILVSRMICRPVKALAEAVDPVGREGHWEPFRLPPRRNDEIGVLIDRVAELGRRLAPEVRAERFGAAHLVATRVQREIAEPVDDLELRVAALEEFIPVDADGSQLVKEIAERVAALRALQQRLGDV